MVKPKRCEECGFSLITISWSSLRVWEECHHKQYRRHEGRANPSANTRMFFPGTLADRTMRWFLNLPESEQTEGKMVEYLPTMFDRLTTKPENDEDRDATGVVKWKGPSDKKEIFEQVKYGLGRLEPILFDLVIPHAYQPEMRFEVPVTIPGLDGEPRSIRLLGYIDIVTKPKDKGFFPYDLKFSKDKGYVSKVLGQGVFYDVAIRHYLGEQPDGFGFIFPLLDPSVIYAKIEDEERLHLMSRIVSYAHGIWREDFLPKESNAGCKTCDVRHACDKFNGHDPVTNKLTWEAAARRREEVQG